MDITAGAPGSPGPITTCATSAGSRSCHGAARSRAPHATAYLTDDAARVETLEMRGQSRITGVGEGAGALRAMEADDINLEFAADGQTLAGATLASGRPGRATIDLVADGSARRIVGQWIDVRFAPDGSTVTALTVRDVGPAQAAAVGDGAGADDFVGHARRQGRKAAGAERGAVRRTTSSTARRRPGAAPRIVRAAHARPATEPGLGAIDRRALRRRACASRRTRRAAARRRPATWSTRPASSSTASTRRRGSSPRVTDGQVTIDATQIEMDARRAPPITAKRDVRSVMVPAATGAAGGAGEQPRGPGC